MANEQIVDAVWKLFLSLLGETQRAKVAEFRGWLSERIENAVAHALIIDPSHGWTPKDIRTLVQAVVDDFRPARRAKVMLGCLDAVLQCWHRTTGIVVPPPNKVFLLRRARNPWRQDAVKGLLFQAEAKATLEKAIKHSSSEPDFDALALGIASGIIHLDLLHPDCILALLQSLANPHGNLGWMGDTFVIRQSLAVRGVPDSEKRIYLPDPLTATLLLQVSPEEAGSVIDAANHDGEPAPKAVLRALSTRIDAALAKVQNGKRRRYSVDSLVRHCTAAALYWRCPLTVAYLRRGLISHSPSLDTLARIEPTCILLSSPTEGSEPSASAPSGRQRTHSTEIGPAETEEQLFPEGHHNEELRWFDSVRKALAGADKRKARQRLSSLLAEKALPKAARCLAGFASWLLNASRAKGRNLRTIRDGLSLLARFLFPLFDDDEDPVHSAKTGIEDLYLEAIDIHQESPSGASLSSQLRFVRWLVRFHDFLVVEHSAKPLEELRSMAAGCLPVDANLLTEDEFLALKQAIRTSAMIPAAQRVIAELLIIIAVRCSLRHNEAFWLRPCDIDTGSPAMLIVQPYGLRGLKTRNALRRLNLTALLVPNELSLLLEFVSRHPSQPLSPMFVPPSGQGLLGEDDLFASIHRIMRETLKDQGLRFHHGRHTFGSLLALQLLTEEPQLYSRFFPSCSATLALLNGSSVLRQALYGCDEVQISAMDGLANMIGHATPKFTAAHYIHTLSVLAAVELTEQAEFACDLPTLIAASRLPSSSAYRHAQQGADAIPEYLFRARFRDQIRAVAKHRRQQMKTNSPVQYRTRFEEGMAIARSLLDHEQSLDQIRSSSHDPAFVDEVVSAWHEHSGSTAEEAHVHTNHN